MSIGVPTKVIYFRGVLTNNSSGFMSKIMSRLSTILGVCIFAFLIFSRIKYFPSIGLLVFIVALIFSLLHKQNAKSTPLLIVGIAQILLVLALLGTIMQEFQYMGEQSMWIAIVMIIICGTSALSNIIFSQEKLK